MKKIFNLTLLFIVSFFVLSCSQNFNYLIDGDNNSSNDVNCPEGKSVVLINIEKNSNVSKLAGIPDFSNLTSDIVKYNITASASGYETQSKDTSATSVSLILDAGVEWTVLVEGVDSNDKVLIKGQGSCTPDGNDDKLNIIAFPYMQKEAGSAVNGSISLDVKLPQHDKKYYLTWYIDGTKQSEKIIDTSSAAQTVTLAASSVTADCHRVTINISTEGSTDNVIKVYDVLVYSNLTTKNWIDDSGNVTSVAYTADELEPLTLNNIAFYVQGTGAGLGATAEAVATSLGKKLAVKCATVQSAVDTIIGMDPTGTYRGEIYIDGTVTQSADGSSDSLVTIGNGSNSPKIKIIGKNSAKLSRDTAGSEARILFIEKGADVIVDGLIVDGGKLTASSSTDETKNGGGIFAKGNLDFTGTIQNCTGGNGGGICVGESGVSPTVKFQGKIISNTSTYKGGGIFMRSGDFTISDGFEVKNNSGSTGGGVYLESTLKFLMDNGEVSSNTAKSGNGGGITCYANLGSSNGDSPTGCCLKNVTMTGNTAASNTTGSGGAVYIGPSKHLTLIGCTINGNTGNQFANGVYNYGHLNLGGECVISDNIYTFKGDKEIRVLDTLAVKSGKTECAVIYPCSLDEGLNSPSIDYSANEGLTILKPISGSTVPDSLLDCFKLSDPVNWYIDTNGKLQKRAVAGGGGIVFNQKSLTFSLGNCPVTDPGDQQIEVDIVIKNSDGTLPSTFLGTIPTGMTNYTVEVYNGNHKITDADAAGFKVDVGVITIPATMVNESYYVQVYGLYEGQGFSTRLDFTVAR